MMVLESAIQIFGNAGKTELSRVRRRGHREIEVDGEIIRVRDQDPLHCGNVRLAPGWSFEDLIFYLNGYVFFWPGTHAGPSPYGERHYERYAHEKPAVLRVATRELIAANPANQIAFSAYNTGAPRCTMGKGSPRGLRTFGFASDFEFPPTRVVEAAFQSQVQLPCSTEIAGSPNGPWAQLRAA